MRRQLAALARIALLLSGAQCEPQIRADDDGSVAISRPGESRSQDAASVDASRASPPPMPGVALAPEMFHRRVPATGPPKSFALSAAGLELSTPVAEFVQKYAGPLWGLTVYDELRPTRTLEGVNGHFKTSFIQFHKGHRVFDGRMVLTSRRGRVVSGGATLWGGLDVEVTVVVPEEVARQTAIERAAAAVAQEPSAFQICKVHPAQLGIIAEGRRLVWKFTVDSKVPLALRALVIDARSGAVLEDYDSMLD